VQHWLVKEEPTHYSFEQLTRDRETEWSGVRNALAQRHLRAMRKGDTGFYYHSGDERCVVGTFRVVSSPEPDPDDDAGRFRVRIRAGSALPTPVPLAEIKADPAFRDFALVRISRLSVMPVPLVVWNRILGLSRERTSAVHTTAARARRTRA
jgi:predicted RNA-binding protein with PUA-like domain